MTKYVSPDSSFSGRKSLKIPSSNGDIATHISFNTNTSLSAIIKVRPEDFKRVADKYLNIKGERSSCESEVLNKHRFDIHAEEAGVVVPFLCSHPHFFDKNIEGDKKLLEDERSETTLDIIGEGELKYFLDNGAEFIPIQISGDMEDAAKYAQLFNVIEDPISADDFTVEGDDVNAVLPDVDMNFEAPIGDVGELIRSRKGYNEGQLDSYERDVKRWDEMKEQGECSDLEYSMNKERLDSEFADTARIYGSFPESHKYLNILAMAGVETVSLQKFYESQHLLSDMALQADIIKDECDISYIKDPIDMLSRYERLLSFNPQELGEYTSWRGNVYNSDNDFVHEFRASLAKLIASNTDALALANSELSSGQLKVFNNDIVSSPDNGLTHELKEI